MKSNLLEALIGALVLVVAGLFVYLVSVTTDVGEGRGGYRLYAKFLGVGSLAVGSDVRLAGIKVGSVVDQELDPQTYQAKVTFTVKQGIELPEDTYAKIASDGLLGGSFLELEPGGGLDMLQPGDEVTFTEGYVDLIDLVGRYAFGSANEGGGETGGNGQ